MEWKDLKESSQEAIKIQQNTIEPAGVDVSILCSVDELRKGTSQGKDEIKVTNDFEGFKKWCKNQSLSTSDDMFDQGAPVENTTFPARTTDCFSQNLNSLILSKRSRSGIDTHYVLYYSGHASKENSSKSGKPTSHLFQDLSDSSLQNGSWVLHDCGYLSWNCFSRYLQKVIIRDVRNIKLLLILDCCYSGEWINLCSADKDLRTLLSDNNCSLVIQAACKKEQHAHGELFTPTLLKLQDASFRGDCSKEFKDLSNEEKEKYSQLGYIQSTNLVFFPSQSEEISEPFFQLSIGFQQVPFYLFSNPAFFWYCYIKGSHSVDDFLFIVDVIIGAAKGVAVVDAEAKLWYDRLVSLSIDGFKLKLWHGSPFLLLWLTDNNAINQNQKVYYVHIHLDQNFKVTWINVGNYDIAKKLDTWPRVSIGTYSSPSRGDWKALVETWRTEIDNRGDWCNTRTKANYENLTVFGSYKSQWIEEAEELFEDEQSREEHLRQK